MINITDMGPALPTPQQTLEWDFRKKKRHVSIAKARAMVVQGQIVRAYEILEGIRFDYISDTAFRDKISGAKKSLESALQDFLLDPNYHDKIIKKYRDMTIEDFDADQKQKATRQSSPVKL